MNLLLFVSSVLQSADGVSILNRSPLTEMFMDNLPIVPCGRPHLVLTLHIKICRVSSIAHEEILLVYNCYRLSCHMVIRCAFLSKAEAFYPSKQHVL